MWFDFENTPHILFLEPLLRALESEGHSWFATARDHAQTVELTAQRGIAATVIGRGDRPGRLAKAVGVLGRAASLLPHIRHRRPGLLVASSRSGAVAARMLGVPAVGLLDYEHAEQRLLAFGCQAIWIPDVLRTVALPARTRRVAQFYAGLKENLYLDGWSGERRRAREALGVARGSYLVVARPPAETAHYASSLSNRLWIDAVRGLAGRSEVEIRVTARTASQRVRLGAKLTPVGNVRFLEQIQDGPELVEAADMVLGGGGTMNREAAVLGVPAWSVFTGPAPAVDTQLEREGRLRCLRSLEDLRAALGRELPERRDRRGPFPEGRRHILDDLRGRLHR